MIQLRHGLMVVGNPLAGKSSALHVLASALSDLSSKNLMDEHLVSSFTWLSWSRAFGIASSRKHPIICQDIFRNLKIIFVCLKFFYIG